METIVSNAQTAAPLGALVALLIGFHDRIDKSLGTPDYRLVPLWSWFNRSIVKRTPLIGLITLILVLYYTFSSDKELIVAALALIIFMVALLIISWLIYEIEDLSPLNRWTANWRIFRPKWHLR